MRGFFDVTKFNEDCYLILIFKKFKYIKLSTICGLSNLRQSSEFLSANITQFYRENTFIAFFSSEVTV